MPREFSFTWVEEGKLAACSAPASVPALETLAGHSISLVINLHLGGYPEGTLAAYGMRELHLPVSDFSAPAPSQIDRALEAIDGAIADGESVAMHCVAGLGRTGTVVACWLVAQGMEAEAAIARVRELRPGSIETLEQEACVAAYAAHRR